MKRGELYRVPNPTAKDPKKSRVFVVVSRQILLDSRFSTVICAPVYSSHHGLSTQVAIGTEEGLKHESSIHCDELVSLPKSVLTNYVGTLPFKKVQEFNKALGIALDIPEIV
ncbi:MAG: type II toxin-antitoxin system PemK/MazF family toxin [Deltaproteobacteria bacterium]|nr:type II toxin-antitoxin system PemK/MazF family toxin [Deltaproteobacteria bacterium]